ncbi:MAG: methyltransferase domain-containing protein [Acidimicrobiia bacterium]|nr:methyltransferase domain-containing protein [Acidimicrobiia bacterium]
MRLGFVPNTGPFGRVWATIFGLFHRNPATNRVVVELAGLRPRDRVLDIGCGVGAALEQAAAVITDGSVTGVDPTEKLARQAARRVPTARVEVAGAESLPFPDGSFTVAWTISAFHHWPDRDAGIAEARRVLELGGVFHLAERLTDRPGSHGLDETEVEGVRQRMQAVGFSTVDWTVHDVDGKPLVVMRAVAP